MKMLEFMTLLQKEKFSAEEISWLLSIVNDHKIVRSTKEEIEAYVREAKRVCRKRKKLVNPFGEGGDDISWDYLT